MHPTESRIIDVAAERWARDVVSNCARCGGECCNCATCMAAKGGRRDVCMRCYQAAKGTHAHQA